MYFGAIPYFMNASATEDTSFHSNGLNAEQTTQMLANNTRVVTLNPMIHYPNTGMMQFTVKQHNYMNMP